MNSKKILELRTPRLRLRQWQPEDREPFAALNADPAVMEFFPSLLSREESDKLMQTAQTRIEEQGWGCWAVEIQQTAQFIGFVGLNAPRTKLPFTPCIEIGWRLAKAAWGHGFATEAASKALEFGFEHLGLEEILSFTALSNLRSQAVMERLGMKNTHRNFEHPGVPEGHPLRMHCLYQLCREDWRSPWAPDALDAAILQAVPLKVQGQAKDSTRKGVNMVTAVVSPMTVCFEDKLEIPPAAAGLDGFRKWLRSADFPEQVRIDYLHGRLEVDMAPEDIQRHVVLKGELFAYLRNIARNENLGQALVDGAQLTSPKANLSCKPDVIFIARESLQSGRVRYLPSDPARAGRFMEIEGAADLVVEVVSDSSVGKDTKRLPPLYAKAGVRELWIADARGETMQFQIFHLHATRYRKAAMDENGFQQSVVFGRKLRLLRQPWDLPGTWNYTVEEAP